MKHHSLNEPLLIGDEEAFPMNESYKNEKEINKEITPNLNESNFSLPPNLYKLNLPPLKPYEYEGFQKNPSNLLQDTRNLLLKTLQKSHFLWDFPLPTNLSCDNYFRFELPPRKFKEDGQINYINLPQYKFHSEREHLNSEQLKQIWNSRSFKVPSEMENLPHLWNISKWLLHSSEERTMFFKKTLATCLRLFFAIPNVINPCSNRVIRVDICESLGRPNIFNVFVNIAAFFLNLFDFFFGFSFSTLNENYESEAMQNVSFKAFCDLLAKSNENYKETHELTEVLQRWDESTKTKKQLIDQEAILKKLREINQMFEKSFEEEMKQELNKDDYEEDEIEIIKENFLATKQEKLYEFLQKMMGNNDTPKVLALVLKKMKAFEIYNTLLNEKTQKISNETENLRKKLKDERPIYSLIGYKRERLIEKWMVPINKSIENEFEANLEKELKTHNLNEEISLFKNYNVYSKSKEHLLFEEIREMRKFKMKPVNKFTIRYPLFESQYKRECNNYGNWSIVKEGSIIIYSNFMFYKVAKALASYFIKLYSLMFKILKWIWQGPFGIKCLFLCSEFYTQYTITHQGEMRLNGGKVRPILRCFLGVIHGIQKSRKSFEDAPDDGFFGKNFGRIINILYCIFVRFFFAGVFIVLIVHPIINIACILGGFLAAITTLIWLVFVEIFLLTWKLLIYDYKSTLRHHAWDYYNKKVEFYSHTHLKLLRSYKWFTLLHLLIDFFFNVIIQFFMVVIMMIFSPLISLFVFVFGIALYVLKSMWDFFILHVIVRCFARVPSSNSTFAYRISGPGISRDFYNTLETHDLSLLVISHLEKLELDQALKEGYEIIEYPKKTIDNQCKVLFDKFMNDNTQNQFAKESFKNVQFLKDSLRYHVDNMKRQLPTIHGGHNTIRFTKEELEKNLILVENILRDIVKEKDMDRYIWDLYHLRPGLFKRLTRNIFQQIFCDQAINAVEEIDHIERVKFKHQNKNFSAYVSKLLTDGEEMHKKRKERAYLKKIDRDRQNKTNFYVRVDEILNFYSYLKAYYNHPFEYTIINDKKIKKNGAANRVEMADIQINIQD